MSEENRLKLENELLFTKSKAQMINLYLDLQQKVEQLEKQNKELKEENKRIFQNVNDDVLLRSNAMNYAELKKTEKKVEQLENIRKEAIDYVYKHIQEYDVDGTFTNLDEFDFIARPQVLLNILNKGDNNGRK